MTVDQIAQLLVVFGRQERPFSDEIVPLMAQEPRAIFSTATGLFFLLATRIIVAMVLLSILDFGFEKWQYERENKMTKQEVRDELKQFEGDPLIRGRIRQIQRQVAMQRMMAAVPEAEVVVTNPTEIAVALRYDQAKMDAPEVVGVAQTQTDDAGVPDALQCKCGRLRPDHLAESCTTVDEEDRAVVLQDLDLLILSYY